MDRYNFVFILEGFEFNRIIYSEICKRPNVTSIMDFYPKNKLLRLIYQLQHARTSNKFFSLPFKSLWFDSYFKNDFIDKSKPIVFIFDARWLEYDYIREYAKWLKKKYPDCILVANYIDIVATWDENAKPDVLRDKFDMLISYDKDDAKKYNMLYHPTVYSETNIPYSNSVPDSDVFFVGAAKNRMQTILETYDKLEAAGLNCYFYVTGAKPPYNQERKGIHYAENGKWLSYTDCIQHVKHSKCILEIMQQGAKGETLRVWETITYGKMLLTNNLSIKESKFYSPDYISVISENGEIDFEKIKNFECTENPFKDKIAPENLLNFIAENL